MNAEERNILRAEHRPFTATSTHCIGCSTDEGVVIYPCEVIQVLDAWQEQTEKLLAIIYDTNAITHADSVEAMRRILTGTATENLKSSDLKTEVDCDHMVYVNEGKPVLMHASLRVTYCPKCGEKL
jgi:hypothetical protein